MNSLLRMSENGSKTAPPDVAGARLRLTAVGVELFLPADAELHVGEAVAFTGVGVVRSDDVAVKRDRTMRYVVIEPTEVALIHAAADERPSTRP